MLKHQRRLLLSASIYILTHSAHAQQNKAADRLFTARSLYYTPTSTGLQSFECKATFDWKDYLSRFSGKAVADDNEMLLYLNATKLSVSDNIKGQGTLEWNNTGVVPEGKEVSVNQIRAGMMQMFSGFFQSWNAYMNGTMVPAPDASTAVRPNGEGFQMSTVAGKMNITETFDKNSLLSQIDVLTSEMAIQAYPKYHSSPDGLIVESVHSLVRQPPTSSAMDVTLSATYAPVSSYQIPASVDYLIKNVASMHFDFSACEVKTTKSSPIKP